MYTLTLVFNKNMDKVLMCYHNKFGKHNFIGGKVNYLEANDSASYRELFEETGITPDLIDLKFVELETVSTSMSCLGIWSLYITTGVLKEDIELKPEKNDLLWVDVNDRDFLIQSYGQGNCYTYLKRSLYVLTKDAKYLQ